jgi:CheY-like chemotaxis protein
LANLEFSVQEVKGIVHSIASLTILLVEDDRADQKLIKASRGKQKIVNDLCIASSAEEALHLLRSSGNHVGAITRPDLILLDLNMPGMGGREFLKQVKADEGLKQIPIVILTSSNSEKDIVDSYRLQAAGFVRKPANLDEFERVIAAIEHYWFVLCKLPRKEY